jgi:hypothetical protein
VEKGSGGFNFFFVIASRRRRRGNACPELSASPL